MTANVAGILRLLAEETVKAHPDTAWPETPVTVTGMAHRDHTPVTLDAHWEHCLDWAEKARLNALNGCLEGDGYFTDTAGRPMSGEEIAEVCSQMLDEAVQMLLEAPARHLAVAA